MNKALQKRKPTWTKNHCFRSFGIAPKWKKSSLFYSVPLGAKSYVFRLSLEHSILFKMLKEMRLCEHAWSLPMTAVPLVDVDKTRQAFHRAGITDRNSFGCLWHLSSTASVKQWLEHLDSVLDVLLCDPVVGRFYYCLCNDLSRSTLLQIINVQNQEGVWWQKDQV